MAITAWFGDLHGNLNTMWDIALKLQERTGIQLDWIFQVGDFGIFPREDRLDPPSRKHAENHGYSVEIAIGDFPDVLSGKIKVPIPTYFIRGNHEDQEFLLNLERERKGYCLRHPIEIVPNLFYVPDGCVFQIDGIRIAGWGGCWGKNTWDMDYWSPQRLASNNKGYTRRLNHMTRDVFERLIRERFDILATHDSPIGTGIQGMPNPEGSLLDPETMSEDNPEGKGVPYIRELIETVRPKYHFSGHWHEFRKNTFGGGQTTSFVLNKVSRCGENRGSVEIVEL